MNKMHIALVFGIFSIAAFLAVNLYTSTSFPGFSNGADCNNCHNVPLFIQNKQISINIGDVMAYKTFDTYRQYSTNEVQVVQVNNRSLDNVEFIRVTMLKNATHFMMYADVEDNTTGGVSVDTSDKFAILFNIDADNFSVGNFINSYNSTDPNLDTRVNGQMALTNGHADLWYVDTARQSVNTTGYAYDMFINATHYFNDSISQDVQVGYWYVKTVSSSTGAIDHHYRIYFVRTLTTNDPNDIQFNKTDGTGIKYAIAVWDNSRYTYHHSSFDNMVIMGNYSTLMVKDTSVVTQVKTSTSTSTVINTVNSTAVVTSTVKVTGSTSGTTSSFTIIFVLAGLMIAVPVMTKLRRRNE